jgi:hypothetical protein
MISLSHKYEEFGDTAGFPNSTASLDGRDIESEKLQSFEEGYQAGWEDSDHAKGDSERKISADLARNLQGVSFGYHEARTALTKALRPLFTEIFDKLLPGVTRSSIGPHIVEQLSYLARDNSDQPIEIIVSRQDLKPLQILLEDQILDPFVLRGQSDLGAGQVYLRLGSQEREIDFEQAIQEIRKSIDNLFEQEPGDG